MSGPSHSLLRLARPQAQAVENKPNLFVVGGFFEKVDHMPGKKMPYPYTFVVSHSEDKGVRITRHFGRNNGMAIGQKSFGYPESRDTQRRLILARLHEVVIPFGDAHAVEAHARELRGAPDEKTRDKITLLCPRQLSTLSREELLYIQARLSKQDDVPEQIIGAISDAMRGKPAGAAAPLVEGPRVAAAGQ